MSASPMSVRLILSWLLITIMLGYGIVQTVITTIKLFR